MAERRMFAKTIVDSDAFLDMPLSTQALYFHLSMRADDDGFINNPKKIQRMIGAADDDLKVLVAKKFIIPFESGIVVIKHWKIHNYIRNDRYKETVYKDEKEQLCEKENKAYTLNETNCLPSGIPSGIPNVIQMDTQVRIGKDRIGKDSLGKKESKKEKKQSFDDLINSYTQNEELREELKNHLATRKAKKATLTNRAIELSLKNLDSLVESKPINDQENEKIKIVQQSIAYGWTGFFELKEKGQKQNKKNDGWDFLNDEFNRLKNANTPF